MINLRGIFLTAAAAALAASSGRADSVLVKFDHPTQAANPGDTVTFSGTITNLGSTVVDLNGCAVNIGGQFTTDDCALFFGNAPFFLSANETNGPFDMFTVTVDVPYTDPDGPKSGTFTVLGFVEAGDQATDGSTLNVLTEQSFQVLVTPEPASAVLLGLALTLAFWLCRRRAVLRP